MITVPLHTPAGARPAESIKLRAGGDPTKLQEQVHAIAIDHVNMFFTGPLQILRERIQELHQPSLTWLTFIHIRRFSISSDCGA